MDLTLEKVSVRLKEECDVEMSHGQLSRVERGESPYSQNLLEGLAKLYRCEPADLISRNKPKTDALQTYIDRLKPADRARAQTIIETFLRLTKPDDAQD